MNKTQKHMFLNYVLFIFFFLIVKRFFKIKCQLLSNECDHFNNLTLV